MLSFVLDLMARSHRYRSFLVYAAVLGMALSVCAPTLTVSLLKWNDDRAPSWVGALPDKAKPGEKVCDVDTRLIHLGFVAAPRLRDTGRWLTGIWVGQVPFYRPLTSYAFWAQWRLWGNFEQRYNLVAVVLHLLAVLALARLARDLLRGFQIPHAGMGALFAGTLFIYGLNVLSSQATITSETFSLWKNQPDSLTLLFFSLCLSAYLRGKFTRESKPGLKIAPTFWYVLLCLTKEAGIFLPLLLPILEAPALLAPGARRAAIRRMLPLLVLLPIYFGLRALFLHDAVGYRYGSNDAWGFRMGSNLAGGFSEAIMLGDWITLTATLIVGGSVWYLTGLSRRGLIPALDRMRPAELLRLVAGPLLLVALASLLLAWQQTAFVQAFDPVSAASQILLPVSIAHGVSAAFFLLCAGRALWQRPVFGLTCYGWALLTLALTLFSPSVLHRYYLMNAGYAALIAGGAMLWVTPLVERARKWVKQAGPTPG